MMALYRILTSVTSLVEYDIEADTEAEAKELFVNFGEATEIEVDEPIILEVNRVAR